jgi:hypothetical protein
MVAAFRILRSQNSFRVAEELIIHSKDNLLIFPALDNASRVA